MKKQKIIKKKPIVLIPELELSNLNENMINVTNSEAVNNFSTTMKAILIVPEFCNFGLLGIGLLEMYNGIEIGHPIYAILFLNLLVAFSSSFLGVLSYLYFSDIVGKQSLYSTSPVFRW